MVNQNYEINVEFLSDHFDDFYLNRGFFMYKLGFSVSQFTFQSHNFHIFIL